MRNFDIQINQMGAKSILIEWPSRIDESILEDVIAFKDKVLKCQKNRLVNHTPSYASLILQYDKKVNFEELKRDLLELYQSKELCANIEGKEWHIPVCYHLSLGVDQESFVSNGISQSELVKLHTNGIYRVYMIGFLPGFLYLGGLPERLHLPRKATPNLKTPEGAVAIGGQQTGIYPIESPGGWHVIGRTPLSLFDLESDTPFPICQGDWVRFYEIDLEVYNALNS